MCYRATQSPFQHQSFWAATLLFRAVPLHAKFNWSGCSDHPQTVFSQPHSNHNQENQTGERWTMLWSRPVPNNPVCFDEARLYIRFCHIFMTSAQFYCFILKPTPRCCTMSMT
ncbi:hypothetical protein EX30DRAFT_186154 [Ascodesmis nigricans]|uniref:Uncharacterized protein n=1 Tax=Ascodesmis nigricans TaxID=341454 RepID=A0A4S2N040_9PEZI|nr:hypothetical protein EX30DRAFT_186154 [Ascodesmis nigricans]